MSKNSYILALPRLLDEWLDYLGCLHLGKKFGEDYPSSLLELSIVCNRFARWGASMDVFEEQYYGGGVSITPTKQLADMVRNIQAEINAAKLKSMKFYGQMQDAIITELDPPLNNLRQRIQEDILAYQGSKGITKANWVIYEKKDLDKLIENLTSQVDTILEMSSALKEKNTKLCDYEVLRLTNEELAILQRVAARLDPLLLQAAITLQYGERMGGRGKYGFDTDGYWAAVDLAVVQQGNDIMAGEKDPGNSHLHGDTRVEGSFIFSQGDRVWVRDMLETIQEE